MKKLLLCVAMLLAMVMLPACDASILPIEDTNGEADTTLATLTDSDLTDPAPQVIKRGAKQSNKKGICTLNVKQMSGVEVLYSFHADSEQTYRFKVTSSLTSGNLRLFAVADGAIIADIPIGKEQDVTISSISGVTSLRAAAESAAFSVEIRRV